MKNNINLLNKKMNHIDSIRKYLSINELKQLNILNLYNENIIQLYAKYSTNKNLNIEEILSNINSNDIINIVLRRDNGVISLELFITKIVKKNFFNKKNNFILNLVNYPKEYLQIFEKEINFKFEEYCEEIYEEELKKQKKNKIKEIQNRLLNG